MHSASLVQTFGDIRIDGQGNTLIINQVVEVAADEIKLRPLLRSSPYIGLVRFEERHKDVFFGRDPLIGQLLAKVASRSLVFVAGASGSGKSSVVRAGLVPQLAARLPRGRFRPLILTPDRDPFESFRSALIATGTTQREADVVRRGPAGLREAIEALRPPDEMWLLVFDQLEELFTLCLDTALRSTFIESLVQLARAGHDGVRLVLCMRADFFDRIGPYPELVELAEQGLCLMADMPASALRQTIEQPAAHHGVVFEEGLVDQIIADVRGRPGALPLLQYTLDLLWREEPLDGDRTLHRAAYLRIGGVEGALRQRAEALYGFADRAQKRARPPEEQQMLRHIFLRLVDLSIQGSGAVAVSKRTALREFARAGEHPLIAQLIDEKLLISNAALTAPTAAAPAPGSEPEPKPEKDRRAPKGTVEIAHEALLSAWPLLRTWIEQGREVIYLRNRMRADALQWLETRKLEPVRAEEELWGGTRLAQALAMRDRADFADLLGGLLPEEDEFLRASESRHTRHDPAAQRTTRIIGSAALYFMYLLIMATAIMRSLKRDPGAGDFTAVTAGVFMVTVVMATLLRKTVLANVFHRGVVMLGLIALGTLVSVNAVAIFLRLDGHTMQALSWIVVAGMSAVISQQYLPAIWLSAALFWISGFANALWPKESALLNLACHVLGMGWFLFSWARIGKQRRDL